MKYKIHCVRTRTGEVMEEWYGTKDTKQCIKNAILNNADNIGGWWFEDMRVNGILIEDTSTFRATMLIMGLSI